MATFFLHSLMMSVLGPGLLSKFNIPIVSFMLSALTLRLPGNYNTVGQTQVNI